MSDPVAYGYTPAATAQAEPADEPAQILSEFHGFFTTPVWPVVPVAPMPNSSRTVLLTATAPLLSKFSIDVAVKKGI